MLLTAVAFFLSIAGIAAFPCWRYSDRWGYAPSTVAGVMLLFVSLMIIGGKITTSEALAHRFAAQPQHQQQASVVIPMVDKVPAEKAPASVEIAANR